MLSHFSIKIITLILDTFLQAVVIKWWISPDETKKACVPSLSKFWNMKYIPKVKLKTKVKCNIFVYKQIAITKIVFENNFYYSFHQNHSLSLSFPSVYHWFYEFLILSCGLL